MANNKITKLLRSYDKGLSKTFGPNGVLSRLWRQILYDLGIGPNQFNLLMHDYLSDPRNGVPNNKKDQTSMRGNMSKELWKPQMTWKVFLKAMRFLQLVKITFTVEAHHANGRITLHSTDVNLGHRNAPNFTEELEQPPEQEAVPFVECLDAEQPGKKKKS
jgi:hypothetical protein